MQENEKKSKVTPPYLSVAKLSQLIALISSRNFSEIKQSDLKHYGFGESDTYVGVGTLRFLGIIDEKNQIQPDAKKLHLQGVSRTEAISAITRRAYAVLFDRVPNLLDLSPEELHNEFLIAYGITPRIARSALPAFLWLCEQAGLKEVSPEAAKRTSKKPVTKSEPKAQAESVSERKPANGSFPDTLTFSFQGGIQLVIPNLGTQISNAIAQGELKDISDGINEFSRKFLATEEELNHD
jgi:hypothetical protein